MQKTVWSLEQMLRENKNITDNMAWAITNEVENLDWMCAVWMEREGFKAWMLINCPKDYTYWQGDNGFKLTHNHAPIELEVDLDEAGLIDAWRVYYTGTRVR